jgi:hypothetical protein
MPLTRVLDQSGSFDLKAVAILLEAYNAVVTELGLWETPKRERAAKLIIWLAQTSMLQSYAMTPPPSEREARWAARSPVGEPRGPPAASSTLNFPLVLHGTF